MRASTCAVCTRVCVLCRVWIYGNGESWPASTWRILLYACKSLTCSTCHRDKSPNASHARALTRCPHPWGYLLYCQPCYPAHSPPYYPEHYPRAKPVVTPVLNQKSVTEKKVRQKKIYNVSNTTNKHICIWYLCAGSARPLSRCGHRASLRGRLRSCCRWRLQYISTDLKHVRWPTDTYAQRMHLSRHRHRHRHSVNTSPHTPASVLE